ncbi:hypothetical protein [Salininema proteolyticum]|uniref:Transcription factor zinc-finger domain-containing protein n=1 Tax=Salininema proteolyticum TaxID=1607685 RepID=A0ABV8TZN6_9ACTN
MINSEKSTEARCPICELRMSEAMTVVSRHRTSTGTVVYARCECGRLSMWMEPLMVVKSAPGLAVMAGGLAR